jgi:hypothetical protein
MKCTPCPLSIGKSSIVYCNNGYISGMRCPYYQQSGQHVRVEELLSSSIFIDTKLIPYIANIQKDYELVGNYRWSCTLCPSVRETKYDCILQDTFGKRHCVDDVISRYKHLEEKNNDTGTPFESGETTQPDGQLYYQ